MSAANLNSGVTNESELAQARVDEITKANAPVATTKRRLYRRGVDMACGWCETGVDCPRHPSNDEVCEQMYGDREDEPADPPHLDGCTGNGSETCWDCGGEGSFLVPFDDCSDEEEECETCNGFGEVRCPGCAAQDAPPPIGGDK